MEPRRRRGLEERPPYVWEERRRVVRLPPTGGHDALGFARRALRILAPFALRTTTVAVYEGRFDVRVEQGRDWSGDADARWAMVAIPPGASHERIAVTLAELAGVADVPFVIETLLAAARVD